jgi:hypothetical protein
MTEGGEGRLRGSLETKSLIDQLVHFEAKKAQENLVIPTVSIRRCNATQHAETDASGANSISLR